MILATAEAMAELARTYEADARSMRRYDPHDGKASLLERVAADLRRVVVSTTPEWVPLASVEDWTGWSRTTLRKRCRDELEGRGLARKGAGGEEPMAGGGS